MARYLPLSMPEVAGKRIATLKRRELNCSSSTQRKRFSIASPRLRFGLFSQQKTRHEINCPRAREGAYSYKFGFRLSGRGPFSRTAIQATLQLSYSAGGYSLSQHLNLRGVVHPSSSAFSWAERLRQWCSLEEFPRNDAVSYLDSCL